MAERLTDINRFYELLEGLATRFGGPRLLRQCNGRMNWPSRCVYFFFESGEFRSVTGVGKRVVRVGTHGLAEGSRTTLWGRLSQHRGRARSPGGNHRGSIFRLILGDALSRRDNIPLPTTWGVGSSLSGAVRRLDVDGAKARAAEAAIEASVSEYIGRMEVLWLEVDDASGPDSKRGLIERNAIAMLSTYAGHGIDGASGVWLGKYSDRERIRLSGLWNINHVDEPYSPSFLDEMEVRVNETSCR